MCGKRRTWGMHSTIGDGATRELFELGARAVGLTSKLLMRCVEGCRRRALIRFRLGGLRRQQRPAAVCSATTAASALGGSSSATGGVGSTDRSKGRSAATHRSPSCRPHNSPGGRAMRRSGEPQGHCQLAGTGNPRVRRQRERLNWPLPGGLEVTSGCIMPSSPTSWQSAVISTETAGRTMLM